MNDRYEELKVKNYKWAYNTTDKVVIRERRYVKLAGFFLRGRTNLTGIDLEDFLEGSKLGIAEIHNELESLIRGLSRPLRPSPLSRMILSFIAGAIVCLCYMTYGGS